MKNQIKIIIGIIIVLLIIAIALKIIIMLKSSNDYALGNYGVTITVPKEYTRYKTTNDSQLLMLKDDSKGLTISATQLRGDFWSSGDMAVINDEYLGLISIAQFDSSILDTESEVDYIGDEPIGIVKLTQEKNVLSKRTITLLTSKAHGYIAIEIYGDTNNVKKYEKDAMKILKSVKFSKNHHNYDLDIPKELTPEEEEEGLNNLYTILGIDPSGELIRDILARYSGEVLGLSGDAKSGE